MRLSTTYTYICIWLPGLFLFQKDLFNLNLLSHPPGPTTNVNLSVLQDDAANAMTPKVPVKQSCTQLQHYMTNHQLLWRNSKQSTNGTLKKRLYNTNHYSEIASFLWIDLHIPYSLRMKRCQHGTAIYYYRRQDHFPPWTWRALSLT